ncbi:hypothetical protein FOZ61_006799 [Perkinsus olseni]|uniref:Uncharacterized protein n=1 Tax=Perkinsus olseni TaxID=32597 RepID=A0A7J6MJ19_PEROL|nr:hypothetical protein FOZ61_006799 [Perkinsus olseni]KAF4676042.1 hypothetical protein FOL46_007921 [Perkinsus olseni]
MISIAASLTVGGICEVSSCSPAGLFVGVILGWCGLASILSLGPFVVLYKRQTILRDDPEILLDGADPYKVVVNPWVMAMSGLVRVACFITNTEYGPDTSLRRLPRSKIAGDEALTRCKRLGYDVCMHLVDACHTVIMRELGGLLRELQRLVDEEDYSGMQLLVAYCGHGAEDGLVMRCVDGSCVNLSTAFLAPLQRVLVGCNVSVLVLCDCCRPYSHEARMEARMGKLKRARSMRLLPGLREDSRERDSLKVEQGILRRARILDRYDPGRPAVVFVFGNMPGRRCWDAILLRAFAQLPIDRPLRRLLRGWATEVARLSVYHQKLSMVAGDPGQCDDVAVLDLIW